MYAKFENNPCINTQVIDRKWCGRTDGQTDTEGYNIIPRHTLVAGYKKVGKWVVTNVNFDQSSSPSHTSQLVPTGNMLRKLHYLVL